MGGSWIQTSSTHLNKIYIPCGTYSKSEVCVACAVIACVSKRSGVDLRAEAVVGLRALNHRGEQAHGIAFLNGGEKVESRRELGLVNPAIVSNVKIHDMFIGHTRYSTSSASDIEHAQPFVFEREGMSYAISHNGNISNDHALGRELGINKHNASDTYVLGELIGNSLVKPESELANSLRKDLVRAVGSYSLALLVGGREPRVIAIRDRFGYMPLCVGENEKGFFVASEDVALGPNYLDAKSLRQIRPGEMVTITSKGVRIDKLFEPELHICMFQFVYMCRPDSTVEGRVVSEVRQELGKIIGMNYKPEIDFVVPVPDSGMPLAFGYSEVTGVPIKLGLVKDRYISQRSFMQSDIVEVKKMVRAKHNPNLGAVSGKRILLVDDSMVRGSTMRRIIEDLRGTRENPGASEIYAAFGCPPVTSQCPNGIDFYNDQLIARPHMALGHLGLSDTVAREIGANGIFYPTIENLTQGIGIPKERLCLGCLTGKYVEKITFENEDQRRNGKHA